jgi:hypothetical protein
MTKESRGLTHMVGIHRKEGEDREQHDFYATSPEAIPPLLQILNWKAPKIIWENSCGQGHLVKPLREAGHAVIATDLIDRGCGASGIDFLTDSIYHHMNYDAIIMNPPYSKALEFVERSIGIAPTVCAFLRIQFLESQRRRKFFEKHPPRYVAVFSSRIASSKNAEFKDKESSTVCYAWFIWKRGFSGNPELIWI